MTRHCVCGSEVCFGENEMSVLRTEIHGGSNVWTTAYR